jgi:hypothetical protein
MSAMLADSKRKWGDPAAIKVGYSGGYFVWKEPRVLLSVKSFGKTSIHTKIPRDLAAYVGYARSTPVAKPQKKPDVVKTVEHRANFRYTVERFERVSGDDFAYAFCLRLKDGADAGLSAMGMVKRELRSTIAEDYVAAHGGRISDVQVDFPSFTLKGNMIEGRAEIMRIEVASLHYDPQAQKGVIAIKIGANRFEDARIWVRKNIESLARDKNVALTTGTIPPAARFYLGAERIKDGNILEIEFETE